MRGLSLICMSFLIAGYHLLIHNTHNPDQNNHLAHHTIPFHALLNKPQILPNILPKNHFFSEDVFSDFLNNPRKNQNTHHSAIIILSFFVV